MLCLWSIIELSEKGISFVLAKSIYKYVFGTNLIN
jgi:hypothetical protein